MKTLIISLGIFIAIGLTIALYLNSQVPAQPDQENPKPASTHSKNSFEEISLAPPSIKPSISKKVSGMTIEERITQLLYVGIEGTSLSTSEKQMISEGRVGGVIFLGRNITSSPQFKKLVEEVKNANSKNPTPLFLGVDEEGGTVSRIPNPMKKLPSSYRIGEENDADLAFTAGKLLAQKVKAFGLNMNFAPVMDINNNPGNQVIGKRSFGDTPERVSRMGIPEMKGIKSEGIVPVLKHFPGHGDTSVDSHINLPVIKKSLSQINQFELIPFKEAINEGADAVMMAHILFPELDDQYPATFSKTIIQNVLRKQSKFDGLVITDDMAMGAISKNFGTNEATIRSIQAGSDMVLMTDTRNGNFNEVKNALLQAVKKGTISTEQINDSVARILRVKQDYHLSKLPQSDLNVKDFNEKVEEIHQQLN
ncbi:beta-N-acetylhexosaminidase [Halobacillus sp. BBL2006]|uniref:beta-N-acetylhexosaminidase n=1 Tax=Halobacillus sp. BBL2006 TaxID=1543706 RepID=UPI000541B1E9|nr:beta-N-acetylhexosaminidase [Halobacillus sp. BBL2006]KHE72625.1 glycoside hydrolase family 3 [Halobacillus sp. BBL2006]